MEKKIRKIEAMYLYYGQDPQHSKCSECEHLISGTYHDKHYYKCTVYGCSHSAATDWRKSYSACGLIGKPFPDGDVRIKDLIKGHMFKKEEQIEGQTEMDLSAVTVF